MLVGPPVLYDANKSRIILPETNPVSPDKRKMKIPEIALYVKDAIAPWETIHLSRRGEIYPRVKT